MDHDALHRKLSHLDKAILQAQSTSLEGSAMLSGVSLTLNDAIRVAANIRNRLAGTARSEGKQSYHVGKRHAGEFVTE